MILKSKDAVCPKPGCARKQLLLTTLSRSQKGNCGADTSVDDVNAKDINGDGKLNEEEMFGNAGTMTLRKPLQPRQKTQCQPPGLPEILVGERKRGDLENGKKVDETARREGRPKQHNKDKDQKVMVFL